MRLVLDDLHSELTARDLICLAAVYESPRATDHAVALSATRLAVVRRVDRATPEDHAALATILTEGDFIWAGLVYAERAGSKTVGLIETFHISQLDQLVARLIELREACGEAG